MLQTTTSIQIGAKYSRNKDGMIHYRVCVTKYNGC